MKKYYLQETKEFGRGLYAGYFIAKGEVIAEFELLVLSPSDTTKVNETDLKYYTFCFNEAQDCLVLGDGEIFNHDDKPNVSYQLVERDGRKLMQFAATKNIWPYDQLFIDYAADAKVELNNYRVNLVR